MTSAFLDLAAFCAYGAGFLVYALWLSLTHRHDHVHVCRKCSVE